MFIFHSPPPSSAQRASFVSGSKNCVKTLIKAGANVKSGTPTPLMVAAENRRVGCVKLLIREGVDLNIQDEDDYTALMKAGIVNSKTCFTTLLQAGAEVDCTYMTMMMTRKHIERQLHSQETGGKIILICYINWICFLLN